MLLTTQYIFKLIGLLVCSDRVMDSGGGNNAKCKYNNFSSIYCLVILIIKLTVPMYSINMIIRHPSGCGICHFVVQFLYDL